MIRYFPSIIYYNLFCVTFLIRNKDLFIEKLTTEAGEMFWGLRAFTALTQVLASVTSTHMVGQSYP